MRSDKTQRIAVAGDRQFSIGCAPSADTCSGDRCDPGKFVCLFVDWDRGRLSSERTGAVICCSVGAFGRCSFAGSGAPPGSSTTAASSTR